MTNYQRLPEHMRDAARLYIERGIKPGDFLTALLANDFMEAVGRADDTNLAALGTWAKWIYNEIPRGAHGSYNHVADWCHSRQAEWRKAMEGV